MVLPAEPESVERLVWRSRFAAQAHALAGSNGCYGDDVVEQVTEELEFRLR